MVSISSNDISSCSCGCHKDEFVLTVDQIYTNGDRFDYLALTNPAFPTYVEEGLVLLRRIIWMVGPG
jgi:hypothetical protein